MACSKADGVAKGYTTICFRNIPCCYDGKKVETELLNVLSGEYDFIYVPHDFKRLPKHANVGYFFVNLTSPDIAAEAWDKLDGFNQWTGTNSGKILTATWADKTQGLRACVRKFKNAPILHDDVPDFCKPLILENGGFVPLLTKKKNVLRPRNVPANVMVGQQPNGAAMEAAVATEELAMASTAPEPCEGDLETNCFECNAVFGMFCWSFRCKACKVAWCRACARQALPSNYCSTCYDCGADGRKMQVVVRNTTIHIPGTSFGVPEQTSLSYP